MTQLDDTDIDRLDRYLAEHCVPAGGLPNFEALDGFLCAVVAAPVLILPSTWTEWVWGHEHAFMDQQTATEMISLLMRAYNLVVERIGDPASTDEPTDDLLPLVALPEADPDDPESLPDLGATDLLVGAVWAYGFKLGRELRAEEWDTLIESSEDLDEALLVIDALMLGLDGGHGGQQDCDDLPTLADRLDTVQAIPSLLHALYVDAQQRAFPPVEPFRRATPKVGRNDPCPCGSGRKYKHCHGAG